MSPTTGTGPTPEEIAEDHARRVRITLSCRDTDALPKVEGAGEVLTLEDGTTVQRMHNGLLVLAGGYLGDWTTQIITGLDGHHEPQEEVAFHAVLERVAATQPEPVMIELGAYWAYYTMWFLRRTGGRAVGIEPDPEYRAVGLRNLEINGLSATILPGAVADAPVDDVSFPAESTGEDVHVPGYTLESLMAATDVERADVVLADIQGFETSLLAAIGPLVEAGRVRFMVISTHHRTISGRATTHQETLRRVEELGGHVLVEHTIGESYSGDGLVVVSFDPQDRDLTIDVSHARYKESYFGEVEPDLQGVLEHLDATLDLQRRTQELSDANRERAEHAEAELARVNAELARVTSAAEPADGGSIVGRARRRLRGLV